MKRDIYKLSLKLINVYQEKFVNYFQKDIGKFCWYKENLSQICLKWHPLRTYQLYQRDILYSLLQIDLFPK